MSEGRCVTGFHLIAAAEKAVCSNDALRSWARTGRGERCKKLSKKIRTGSRKRKDLNFIEVHGMCIILKVNKFNEEEFAFIGKAPKQAYVNPRLKVGDYEPVAKQIDLVTV